MPSLLAAAFLLAVSLATPVFACQCGRLWSVEEAAAAAQYVVTGVVLAEHPSVVRRSRLRFGAGDARDWPLLTPVSRLDIAVSRVFKGGDVRRLTLTHFGCCICEERLEVGNEYLLFVRPHHSLANASMAYMCDPNKRIEDAGGALDVLGPPQRVHSKMNRSRTVRDRAIDVAAGVLNVGATAVSHPRWYVERPLQMFRSVMESPWSAFAVYLFGAGAIGLLVVFVRRRWLRRTV